MCKCVDFLRIAGRPIMISLQPRLNKAFDTVVLNPPFGTKQNKGIDMIFLQQAINVCFVC
jgi:predicted RNA methylase